MSNHSLRLVIKAPVLALLFLASFAVVTAQTPSPTPVNPATRPPGEQTQPPTAPPATQQPTPPGAEAVPALSPTPIQPSTQEPREPNFPQTQAQPVPPLPDLTRIGVLSSNCARFRVYMNQSSA